MGLDGVELVMDVEDRFGITIRDDEAASIITVDDLDRLVFSRIAARQSDLCPTFRAFLGVRSDVRRLMDVECLRIRPRQAIAAVVPKQKREALWQCIAKRLGTSPPDLRRPRTVRIALLVAAVGLVMAGLAPVAVDPAILPLSLFVAAVIQFGLGVITRPLCLVPPPAMATFGDAARAIAGTMVAMNESASRESTAAIHEALREIIVEVLGVNRAMVVPTARFVEDLGLGR